MIARRSSGVTLPIESHRTSSGVAASAAIGTSPFTAMYVNFSSSTSGSRAKFMVMVPVAVFCRGSQNFPSYNPDSTVMTETSP